MRFIYVISLIVLCGVIGKVTGKEANVIAKQVRTKINPKQDILLTKTPIGREQNITWNKSFATDFLIFGGEAQYMDKKNMMKTEKLDWNAGFDICEELEDNSLADLAGQILRKSWLPKAKCPVQKGTYKMINPIGPTVVTLPDHSNCPRYIFKLVVGHSKDQLIFETEYYVEVIPEGAE